MVKRKITLEFELDEDFAKELDDRDFWKNPEDILRRADAYHWLRDLIIESRIPLSTIHGYAQLMIKLSAIDENFTNLTKEQIEYLHIILDKARWVELLLRQISQLASLEVTTGVQYPETVELDQLILSAIDHCKKSPLISDQNQFELQLSPIQIKGSDYWLGWLIYHLLENAILYNIANRPINIQLIAQADQVHIIIADHGIGIDPADLARLFETYMRSQAANVQKHDRLGLGLSIAKKIVDLHHGDIWIESQLGEGTTVHITFPMSQSL